MASMYEKPVRLLMQDMIPALGLKKGDVFTRNQVLNWFNENYPDIKSNTVSCHLTRLSTNAPSRVQFSVKADGSDDHFYKLDRTRFRLYDPMNDPIPVTYSDDNDPEPDEIETELVESSGEFAYEHDLRDFLAKNMQLIEPGLRLYEYEGISGKEFDAGGRYIDLLAVDTDNNFVVIELKVSKGYDRVCGQLLRYLNWIKLNHADPGQSVRGLIIAKDISEDLQIAVSGLPNVDLIEYELAVTLKKVNKYFDYS